METKKDFLESKVKEAVKEVLKAKRAYQYWPVKATPLGAKTVDCLACVPIIVTQDMVGENLGIFVAIETKRTSIDKPTRAQEQIIQQVNNAGGGAVLIHTVDEAQIEEGLRVAIGAGSWITIGERS